VNQKNPLRLPDLAWRSLVVAVLAALAALAYWATSQAS
jgi:hypothetical protein